MLCKNTSPLGIPADINGRMVAFGETADLDPENPAVAGHLTAGHLTPVQGDRKATRKTTTTTEG